jgi:hypothetical protein
MSVYYIFCTSAPNVNNNQISYLNSSHETQPAGEMSMYRQNPNFTNKKAQTTSEVNQHTHQRIFQCCTHMILLSSGKYLWTVYIVKKFCFRYTTASEGSQLHLPYNRKDLIAPF